MAKSDFFSNPIVNLTGSIPAASQGNIIDIPGTGIQGQWYLALDQKIMYEWNGAAWVVALDGSGSGSFDFNYPFGPVNTITVSTALSTIDNIYFVNNSAVITIQLPVVGISTGKIYTIKRLASSTAFVTIIATAGNIDGVPGYIIDMPGGMVQFCWNGTTWSSITFALAINASVLRFNLLNTPGLHILDVGPAANLYLANSFAGAMTLSLLSAGNYIGHVYNIKKIAGAAAVILTCDAGSSIDGFLAPLITVGMNQNIEVVYLGSNNFAIL